MKRRVTPKAIEREIARRYRASTGEAWREASVQVQKDWRRAVGSVIRCENNIALGAVWRDGDWHAPDQTVLFDNDAA